MNTFDSKNEKKQFNMLVSIIIISKMTSADNPLHNIFRCNIPAFIILML